MILSDIPLDEILDRVRQVVREEIATTPKQGVTTSDDNKLITQAELCEYLDVSKQTIIKWQKKKAIPFYEIGSAVRYRLSDVLKSIEKK